MREPLYITICNDVRSKIQSGEFTYGHRLPSEREMAEFYQIDRKTLRKAISLLIEEGLLVRMQGKGTYITQQQISYDVEALDDLVQTLTHSGMVPSSRILYKEVRKAGPKYAKRLQISPDDNVLRLVRLRSGDNEPIALQDTYIIDNLVPNLAQLDFEMYSLYNIMDKNGISISRIDETFTFIQLSNPEAKLLKLEEGSIGFVTEDITYDQNNRVVEYTKSIINNKKLSVNMNYFKPDAQCRIRNIR